MSRRRRKNRKARIRALVIVLAIFITVGIASSASNATGKFGVVAFLIILFSLIVGFGILFFVLSLPSVKGKIGEHKVSKGLNKIANKYGGFVIDDVIVPGENDKTSQIDHILVTRSGIYVVETKNYSGRIYGNDKQMEWTQVLAYGHDKHKIYNPVKQNQTHIYRLQQLLNIKANFISVVIFVKGNTEYIESSSVYSMRELKKTIRYADARLTEEEIDNIYNVIVEYKTNPTKTNKQHIAEIKQIQKDIDNNICPRCGGNLVLRKSKSTGDLFYACENYPKCTFIKKK